MGHNVRRYFSCKSDLQDEILARSSEMVLKVLARFKLVLGTSNRSRSRPKPGYDPEKKSGDDRARVATQKTNPVATEV
jgi:hypothetical protein